MIESIIDAGSEAAGGAMDVVGGAAEESWFDQAWDTLTEWGSDAADWFEGNPVTTKVLGSLVSGAASGYMRQRERDEDYKRNKLNVTEGNYNSPNGYTIGTSGLLASATKRKEP